MSGTIDQDVDSSPRLQRTTDRLSECRHIGDILEYESRLQEDFLREVGDPKGGKRTRLLAQFMASQGDRIRKDYCITHCHDLSVCHIGRGYLNQRMRRLRFPLPGEE